MTANLNNSQSHAGDLAPVATKLNEILEIVIRMDQKLEAFLIEQGLTQDSAEQET